MRCRKTMGHEVLSPFFLEAQEIRYAIANEKFGTAIIDPLSECFSREPMNAALGLSARDLAPLVAHFIPECTTNGRSVITIPANHSETLTFICRDFKSPLHAGVPGDFAWFTPIAEAYRDFRFKGRAVFAGIEPAHANVILFEREFDQP